MEAFPLKASAGFRFEPENFVMSRSMSVIWSDPQVTASYANVPVCYDELHPDRIQYVDGNDIKTNSKLLYYRIDGGEWSHVAENDGTFDIPPFNGKRLEFAFVYDLAIDLNRGLGDINRC